MAFGFLSESAWTRRWQKISKNACDGEPEMAADGWRLFESEVLFVRGTALLHHDLRAEQRGEQDPDQHRGEVNPQAQ